MFGLPRLGISGALLATSVQAATLTVDFRGGADYEDVQSALDAAQSGDTVIVEPGEYVIDAPLDFNRLRGSGEPPPPTKDLALVSRAGPESTVVRMGVPSDPLRAAVVVFSNQESEASRLDGFTLTGGAGVAYGNATQSSGGGIYIVGASPRVSRCRIWRNSARKGGGVFLGGPAKLDDCTIEGNRAEYRGGAVYESGGGAFRSCRILGNWAQDSGGATFCLSHASYRACVVAGNFSAGQGGITEAGWGSSSFVRCTLTANGAGDPSPYVPGYLLDSILWANDEPADDPPCDAARGILCEDPRFIRAPQVDFQRFVTARVAGAERQLPDFLVDAGDLHLAPDSPAIDFGRAALRDPDGTRLDAGAFPFYQGPPRPSRTIVVDPSGGGDFRAIQEAVDASLDGDEIVVRPGTYDLEAPIRLHGRTVRLRSEAGPEVTVLRRSIPPEELPRGQGYVCSFADEESPSTIFEGFTVTGGRDVYGGGMSAYGGSPTIRNCRIVGNVAIGSGPMGGGILYWGSTWQEPGSVEDCTIEENSCARDSDLGQASRGGGIFAAGGVRFVRCRIAGNDADEGGGVYARAAEFERCTIVRNVGVRSGGGLLFSPGSPRGNCLLRSCTISGNASTTGGGIATSYGPWLTVESSIVWDNAGGAIEHGDGEPPSIAWSCVEADEPWPGDGNIAVDPGFVAWPAAELWIDPAVPEDGDGSEGAPMRRILEALRTFRVDPGEGSPCVGTGKDGADMGSLPPANDSPGPPSVRIVLNPGRHILASPSLANRVTLVGAGSEATIVEGTALGLRTGAALQDLTVIGGPLGSLIATSGDAPTVRGCAFGPGDGAYPPRLQCGTGSGLELEDCVLEGGLFPVIAATGSEIRMAGCTIRGNQVEPGSGVAPGWGAVDLAEGCSAEIRSCVFSGNKGTTRSAIQFAGSTLDVAECSFVGNDTHCLWGKEESALTVSDSRFEDDTGFAIYSSASSVEVSASTFLRTRGIEFWGSSLIVRGSEILASSGTGIGARYKDSLLLEACTIAGNDSWGIRSEDVGAATIVNCVVVGNRGGGLALGEGRSRERAVNCTFHGNVSSETGVPPVPYDLSCSQWNVIRNCVLTGARSENCRDFQAGVAGEDPLFVRPGTFDFTRYLDVEVAGRVVRFPDYLIDIGDYHVLPGSPAIDGGGPALAPDLDLEGTPRPLGLGFDAGAFEAMPGTPFRRGDTDSSGALDITDPIVLLLYLFLQGDPPVCIGAADADDSGDLSITDAIYALGFLFVDGPPPPPPFPACGADPTPDPLGCAASPGC